MNFWTYSPEDVQILIAGVHPLEGLAQGTFVEISKDVQPMVSSRSVDGMVVRKHTTDNTFTVNLTIYRSSPSNDLLTKLWQIDEITQMMKFPLLIKDSTGTGFFFSTTSWVENIPNMTYSTDMGTYTWGIRSAEASINIGGNDESSVLEHINNLSLSGLPLLNEVLRNV